MENPTPGLRSDSTLEEENALLRAENLRLRAVEVELESVLENMGSAFFRLDQDFMILRVNKLYEKAVHRNREDILGKSFWELHFSDPATHKTQSCIKYHEAMKERRSVSFVDYFEGLDIWTDVKAYPTSDGGLDIFYHDITVEKTAEIEAAESKHKFEAIFEGSATPLAFFRGPELVYEFYNSKYQELIPRRELLGRPLLEALPEVASTAFPEIFKKVFETGAAAIINEESAKILNPATGEMEERFFDNTVSRINDGTGRPFGVFVQALEVTERVRTRKRLEQALAAVTEASNEIDDVLECMSDTFFIIDENWIVRRVNAQFEKVSQMDRKDVVGHNFLDLFFSTPELKESMYVKTYSKVMTERKPEFFVDYYEPLNIWTAVSAYPKSSGGVALFFKEISEEKRAALKLQEAINARDRFLSIASHELRTPITGMKLQVQMMERSLAKHDLNALSPDRVTKLVRQTSHGLDRMNRLVEDMLDISRIQNGKLTLNIEPDDLPSLVREIADRFSEQLLGAEIPFKVLAEPTTPPVPIDRFRMEQVLTNLITNSIRYAPHAPASIRLDFSDQQFVAIVFQDGGPGVSEENRERVFERFERLVSANEISGLGLGLFIAREIVQAHGGTIRLESGEASGAKFVIRLPRQRGGKSGE